MEEKNNHPSVIQGDEKPNRHLVVVDEEEKVLLRKIDVQ